MRKQTQDHLGYMYKVAFESKYLLLHSVSIYISDKWRPQPLFVIYILVSPKMLIECISTYMAQPMCVQLILSTA